MPVRELTVALPEFLAPVAEAPAWQKVLLGVLGLALIGAGAYFAVLAPLQAAIGSLREQRASIERELAQARAGVADLARFRREVAELEQRIEQLRQRLPTDKDVPPLYRTLSDAAFQSGLAVSLFQPREPRVRDYYSEIPISLTAEGGYHQIGEFLDRVARLPRVVTVGDFRLTGLGKAKPSLRAEVTFATYTYRPVGSPPAPRPAGAPGAPR